MLNRWNLCKYPQIWKISCSRHFRKWILSSVWGEEMSHRNIHFSPYSSLPLPSFLDVIFPSMYINSATTLPSYLPALCPLPGCGTYSYRLKKPQAPTFLVSKKYYNIRLQLKISGSLFHTTLQRGHVVMQGGQQWLGEGNLWLCA